MFSLSLSFHHICSVCRINRPEQSETFSNQVCATLFGTGPGFPFCPCCWGRADHLFYDAGYQRRAARWAGIRRVPQPLLSPEPVDPMLLPFPLDDGSLGPRVTAPPAVSS
jgi:hypothetical protein